MSVPSARDNEQKDPQTATFLVNFLRPSQGLGSVLDVGCGTGALLKAAQCYATSVTGVDVSEVLVRQTKSSVSGVEAIVASVESGLPFGDETFDTVFFCDVLEHLTRPVEALREIRRVLRPNGRVLLTTPNSNSLIRYIAKDSWFGVADPTHVLFYTSFTLNHLLSKIGLQAVMRRNLGLTGSQWKDAIVESMGAGGTLLFVATRPLPTL